MSFSVSVTSPHLVGRNFSSVLPDRSQLASAPAILFKQKTCGVPAYAPLVWAMPSHPDFESGLVSEPVASP